ncbi:hypothetical protein L5515_019111 [Caenorhabditis briggsae]|uniref:Uncharacterized protein n=1 Tax=Caenorhabditis briggsae TaxID=6238 RepID=A0AAE9JTP7_CAEBR|nr:hypothetical protein L5515_019111 [Caenorhabditis briggsae]
MDRSAFEMENGESNLRRGIFGCMPARKQTPDSEKSEGQLLVSVCFIGQCVLHPVCAFFRIVQTEPTPARLADGSFRNPCRPNQYKYDE